MGAWENKGNKFSRLTTNAIFRFSLNPHKLTPFGHARAGSGRELRIICIYSAPWLGHYDSNFPEPYITSRLVEIDEKIYMRITMTERDFWKFWGPL